MCVNASRRPDWRPQQARETGGWTARTSHSSVGRASARLAKAGFRAEARPTQLPRPYVNGIGAHGRRHRSLPRSVLLRFSRAARHAGQRRPTLSKVRGFFPFPSPSGVDPRGAHRNKKRPHHFGDRAQPGRVTCPPTLAEKRAEDALDIHGSRPTRAVVVPTQHCNTVLLHRATHHDGPWRPAAPNRLPR